MPLQISRNDILGIKADAIVCPTDAVFSGSGGTDRLIHQAAGIRLDEACSRLPFLKQGQAVHTGSYDLKNCSYIIHACGPIYVDGKHGEEEVLASCYRESLDLAKELELSSIAFPLISSGNFAFPKGSALRIASDTIASFLLDNEMDVSLLVYDKESFDSANKLYADIRDYLTDHLRPKHDSVSHHIAKREEKEKVSYELMEEAKFSLGKSESYSYNAPIPRFEPDESFSECLIRMIDERKIPDPEVYKKANIDRKHFNHIKNTKDYRPKKKTVAALAIGMKLNMKDTNTLMERAGFVLSRSSKFDLIIRYCIEHQIYDIFRINEILFEEDQETLGC